MCNHVHCTCNSGTSRNTGTNKCVTGTCTNTCTGLDALHVNQKRPDSKGPKPVQIQGETNWKMSLQLVLVKTATRVTGELNLSRLAALVSKASLLSRC